jgi:hypothetical protein
MSSGKVLAGPRSSTGPVPQRLALIQVNAASASDCPRPFHAAGRRPPGMSVQDATLGHLRRLRTISRQRFILPVDPIDVMRFEVAGDGCTNGREERLFAKMCEQSESLQLVFDWIFELGKT